ncbi:MAG: IS30 family transposase [Actinobacteria bacterium]|nr:IS30 family transposase [Actinomycetota bacterium]MCG2808283.1 IS30 family transposase [Coriobacteriia bacterium]
MPEIPGGYRHLTYDDRCEIQRMLGLSQSVSSIARSLSRSVSSITREIVRNRRDDGYRSTPTAIVRLCVHYRTCKIKSLCRMCSTRRCASCMKMRCTNICPQFTADVCKRTAAAPFVCDGCVSISGCRLHRYRYDAKLAQAHADSRLRDSRVGIDTTSESFEAMIETARPLICERGQSIAHVWATHRGDFPCSERTFYRYVDAGFGGMKNLDLVAKCRYRPRRGKRPQARFCVPEGHAYTDFCALPEDERLSAVEIDCVEGVRTDTKVFLTMLHKRTSFLFVFLLDEHTQACVEEVFDSLEALLKDGFPSTFPLVLTDRGHEFQNPDRIERGGRTRVYYCDAGRADQKGSIENCHRLLRRIVPKGASIDGLTRRDAAIIASHVNSMPRPSLGGASPFDLARHVLPAELPEGLGLEHLTPDNVMLRPSVLTGGEHRN